MIVRRFLHKQGFRFILHKRSLPGSPDIVLNKYKTAIFVHGCFWHAHEGCKYYRNPKSNQEYWLHKIRKNVIRDEKHIHDLRRQGWKPIIVWECELKRDSIKRCMELVKEIQEQTQK